MANDKVDLKFVAQLNADPAIKAARAAGDKVEKALTIKTKNTSIRNQQADLRKLQSTAETAYDAIIDKTREWAKAKHIYAADKKVEYAKTLPEYAQFTNKDFVDKQSSRADSVINKYKKLSQEAQKVANATQKQTDAEQQAANAAQQTANKTEKVKSGKRESAKVSQEEANYQEQVGKAIDENTQKEENLTRAKKEGTKATEKAAYEEKARASAKSSPINVDLDADTSKMGIAELTRYLEQLKLKVKEIRATWKDTGFQSDSRDAEYDRTIEKLNEAKQAAKDYGKVIEETNQAISTAGALNAINGTIQGISSAKTLLDGALNVVRAIGPAAQTAGLISETALANATAGLSLIVTAVNEVVNVIKTIENVAKRVFTSFCDYVKKAIKLVTELIDKVRTGLKKALDSVGDSADKVFSAKNLKRTLQMLTKYIFGVRSFFFLYRKLRAGITEGLKNLVQFESATNETNHAITELRTSLLYLKNAWAAAFAPIINYVYPVLVRLMDMLASIGNAIARFIAAITGASTVLQAVKVDAGDYADSLKSAGGSAKKAADEQKKLNDRLAAFDDLNVLGRDKDDEDTSPSGGGGGGADDLLDPNSMFERIQTPFNRLAQMLKDAWKSGNAFDLGDLFATNLEISLEKAHSWLTGEGKALILKIANLIGTFIDGALSHEKLGERVGTVISDAFTVLVETLGTLITPERFYKIGTFVVDALNVMVKSIVPKIGTLLGNMLRSGISYAFAFIENADWKKWGEAFANSFNNFFAEMSRVNKETNMTGWQELGQSIMDGAMGLLDMIIESIKKIDIKQIQEAIAQLFERLDWNAIKSKLGELWEAVWSVLEEIAPDDWNIGNLKSLFESIFGLIQSVGTAIEKIPWSDIVRNISSIINKLAELPWDSIGESISNIIENTDWNAFGQGLNQIVLAIVAMEGLDIAGKIAKFVAIFAILDSITKPLQNVMGIFDKAKSSFELFSHTLDIFSFEPLLDKLFAFKTPWESTWNTIQPFAQLVWELIDSAWSNLVANFGEGAVTLQDTFILIGESFGKWNDWWSAFSLLVDLFVQAVDAIVEAFTGIPDALGGLSDRFIAVLNPVIDVLNNFLDRLAEGVNDSNNILGSVAGGVVSAGFGVIGGAVSAIHIPHLAQGAVIPPNKQFMAVLGDQTSGTNIEAPLDTIKQAVGEEFAPYFEQMINATLQVVQAVNNKNLVIGDREIGKANARYVNQQKMIKGTML